MAVDKSEKRWYIYHHKEKKGLATSLDLPEIVNIEDKYDVWGPFTNSEIVNKWIEKRKELLKENK